MYGGEMDKQKEEQEIIRLNSSVLSRIDKDFLKLCGTASQVAIYRYNYTTKCWDETNTVGCLFLYERRIDPRYGLVVMNRKNANNFVQYFGSDGQVLLKAPYLLMKSGDDTLTDLGNACPPIYCIWFYETQDCFTAANILRTMRLKFEGESTFSVELGTERRSPASPGPLDGNALLQLLQRVKKECPLSQTKPVHKAKMLTAEELEMRDDISQQEEDVCTFTQTKTVKTAQLERNPFKVIPSDRQLSTIVLQKELIKTLGINKNFNEHKPK